MGYSKMGVFFYPFFLSSHLLLLARSICRCFSFPSHFSIGSPPTAPAPPPLLFFNIFFISRTHSKHISYKIQWNGKSCKHSKYDTSSKRYKWMEQFLFRSSGFGVSKRIYPFQNTYCSFGICSIKCEVMPIRNALAILSSHNNINKNMSWLFFFFHSEFSFLFYFSFIILVIIVACA